MIEYPVVLGPYRVEWERARLLAGVQSTGEAVAGSVIVPARDARSAAEMPPAAQAFAKAVSARGWRGRATYALAEVGGELIESVALRMALPLGGDPCAVRAVAVWSRSPQEGRAGWSADSAYGWVPGHGMPELTKVTALRAWMLQGGVLRDVEAALKGMGAVRRAELKVVRDATQQAQDRAADAPGA